MVEVVVDGPNDKTIRPWAPRSHWPYESVNISAHASSAGEHIYMSVNGVARRVNIGVPIDLTESEISALTDSGFTVTEEGE